jgi:hypothetical protein
VSTAYDEIRTAASRGFSVDNLRTITNLSLAILQENPTHPAIFLTIAAVSRWVADAWDGIPLLLPVAHRVERQLKPHLVALLNVAEGTSDEVCAALDTIAVAFRETVRLGLDSDLT